MLPETQTFFSLTLFLALSSLLAWTNRRNRRTPASVARHDQSVETA